MIFERESRACTDTCTDLADKLGFDSDDLQMVPLGKCMRVEAVAYE
jgi:hypothetical protein